jgi:RNA polymerase sigma-70 factor, ECF subfamily
MHAVPVQFSSYFSVAVARRQGTPRRIEPSSPDSELVVRARRGDRWAEEVLYQRHVRDVMRLVLRLLARSAEAEDVVQDAFVIAFGGLDQLHDDDAFGRWLLRIAVRQVHRRFRKRKLLRSLGLDRAADDATLAAQTDPSASPEVRAMLAEVDRILAELPARCRVVWILRHVEHRRIGEIASACECSRATVKRLLVRANAALSEYVAIDREGFDE